MRNKCDTCKGKGFIVHSTTCPKCAGVGAIKLTIGSGSGTAKDEKCPTCKGEKKFEDQETCPEDCIDGFLYFCDFCGVEISKEDNFICGNCRDDPFIVKLVPPLNEEYLKGERALAATVIRTMDEGEVLVQIGDRNLGLRAQFKTNAPHQYNSGDTVAVRARRPLQNTPGWKNHVVAIRQQNFKIKTEHKDVPERSIAEFKEVGVDGGPGTFVGQILEVKYIRDGPTFFTLIDESGESIQGTAFGLNNQRAFPSFDRYSVVNVIAEMDLYKEKERFHIYALKPVPFAERTELHEKLANVIKDKGSTIEEIPFSIESDIYEKIRTPLVEAAKEIREAIISGRSILIRYHSPCVDGITAAFSVDYAIRAFLKSRGRRTDEFRHIIRRLPLKGTMYEASDIIRDISFVIDGPVPGEKMPLVILMDLGSSRDSLPAYQVAKEYELPIIVVDHHEVDDEVKNLASIMVNPSLVSDDYRVSGSMLGFELARLIFPEEEIDLYHLAAIGGLSDKITGLEIEKYLEKINSLPEENRITKEDMYTIINALEYTLFGLRFSDGGEVIRDILRIGKKDGRADEAAKAIGKMSIELIENALISLKENTEAEEVNGIKVNKVNVDLYAPRYEFPTHGLLISHLHESIENEADKVITLGIGVDYIIFRGKNLSSNLTKIIAQLKENLPSAMITGGGHAQVGTINFLPGYREQTISELLKIIS
jgi:archaea-specific RecJ-like exonuclease